MPTLVVTPTVIAYGAVLEWITVEGLSLSIITPRPSLTLTIAPGVILPLSITARRPTLAVRVQVSHPTAIVAPRPSLKLVLSSGGTLSLIIPAKRPVVSLSGSENTVLAVSFAPIRPLLRLESPAGLIASVIFKPLRPTVLLSGGHGAAMTLALRAQRPVLFLAGGPNATFPISFIGRRPVLVLVGSIPLNDVFQAWVMNTQTTGHAQYENFGFKSFVKHQGKYYGCNATGIFELSGNLDNGARIDARILTGISNLGAEGLKYVPDAYLMVRGEGTLELSIITGETQRVDYAVDYLEGQQGVHTKRCKLAKGVIGEHWQAEIRNVSGGDFDIAKLELITVPTRRR